jgi:polar amino acid transport system substrate-binding protein
MQTPSARTRFAGFPRWLLAAPRWLPLAALILVLALFGRGAAAKTQAQGAGVRAGSLRVAFDLGRDDLVSQDPTTGELQGVEVDLARALAAQLGRTLVPVVYKTGSVEGLRIYQGIKKQEWDIAFLPADPRYANLVDFTTAYVDVDSTYLVRPGLQIASAADVDHPGVRVAVQDGTEQDRVLTPVLAQAQIERVDAFEDAVYGVKHGVTDVIAADRPTLLKLAQQIPGSRVLPDHFAVVSQAIAIPKGRDSLAGSITAFLEQAKADGTVARAIQTSGNRAVQVSPAAVSGP